MKLDELYYRLGQTDLEGNSYNITMAHLFARGQLSPERVHKQLELSRSTVYGWLTHPANPSYKRAKLVHVLAVWTLMAGLA